MAQEKKNKLSPQKKQPEPPDLTAVLRELKRDIGISLNCCQIGIVESFDAARQLVSVRLALKQVVDIAADGTKTLKEHPVLLECPVVVLYGGSSYISFPIAPGDNCLVIFNDREIDQWLYNGAQQTQVPMTARIHDINDGFALIGIHSLQNSIANYLTNGIRLHRDGDTKIDITPALIDSMAALFHHHGNMTITGNVRIEGNLTVVGYTEGDGGGAWIINSDIHQQNGKTIIVGDGATGNFTVVDVEDGIVKGGS